MVAIHILVAGALGIGGAELRARSRGTLPVAQARQTAMYLAHTTLGMSYSAIGRACGRDRATVAHACRRVEERREDPRLDAMIAGLEQAIVGKSGVRTLQPGVSE